MTVRLAALGDSITLGMGDPMPSGEWRGFASLLADSLDEPGSVELQNLATSGALSGDVAESQLPMALAWQPDVATVVVGVNDTLRGSFDIKVVSANVRDVLERLSAAGTCVVTACLPDPGRMLRLPRSLSRPLARRIAAVNTVIHAASAQYGAAHAHLASDSQVFDPRMWSVDRLHPSERGHRHLARLLYDALVEAGRPVGRRPDPDPENPPPTRGAQALWMATKGVRWVVDRSGDLMPQLVALAYTEWRLSRRGLTDWIDRQAEQETAAALALLASPNLQGMSVGGRGYCD